MRKSNFQFCYSEFYVVLSDLIALPKCASSVAIPGGPTSFWTTDTIKQSDRGPKGRGTWALCWSNYLIPNFILPPCTRVKAFNASISDQYLSLKRGSSKVHCFLSTINTKLLLLPHCYLLTLSNVATLRFQCMSLPNGYNTKIIVDRCTCLKVNLPD